MNAPYTLGYFEGGKKGLCTKETSCLTSCLRQNFHRDLLKRPPTWRRRIGEGPIHGCVFTGWNNWLSLHWMAQLAVSSLAATGCVFIGWHWLAVPSLAGSDGCVSLAGADSQTEQTPRLLFDPCYTGSALCYTGSDICYNGYNFSTATAFFLSCLN